MRQYTYPFSAIVGQERMKTALLLNAVDPSIGGVLINGHKGTGKSTAVRALAQILPLIETVEDCPFHCPPDDAAAMCEACQKKVSNGETLSGVKRTMPIVDLPLSATEDRVVGTLHVEHALKTGKRRFEPGLMAAANRGILYVDEVNLLDDHLVDILLDAAASGVNIVEREGISHCHPAAFMLVGTMNPEEGDLRPQFLDRFGLSVPIKSLSDNGLRQAIARRRIDFDQDPESFIKTWSDSDRLLTGQILQARANLKGINIPDAMLDLAVRISTEVEVQGHRSDIVILKTATALAAILEKKEVEPTHIAEAARFALPHRITHSLMATPDSLEERLEDVLAKILDDKNAREQQPVGGVEYVEDISTQVPGHVAASNADIIFSFLEEKKKLFLTPTN